MKLRKKWACLKSIKLSNTLTFQQRLLNETSIWYRILFSGILMTVLLIDVRPIDSKDSINSKIIELLVFYRIFKKFMESLCLTKCRVF